jgi:regulation of enolase protein 1 (concanavalin A-like superfamily)
MLKRQKGQGLVEFGLILPVLLLIILAVIEMALIFQGYLAVQHAAREAARWAVTYNPERGKNLDGSECCPNETDEEYWARRVELIKQVAVDSAVGLRIDHAKLGLTEDSFNAYLDEPNFFGVEIWGAMTFFDPQIEDSHDKPGLPGLPVRVRVTHNVELLDPIFSAIKPRVRVHAQTEMINEGTQAGFGNVAPPALPPAPPIPPGPPPGPGTPTVDFESTVYQVGEGEGSATITVILNAPAEETITVNYATSNGTANADPEPPDHPQADYTATGGILYFDPGETVQTFGVFIVDDAEEEDSETVILTLSGGNATIGGNNPAELVILDNDGSVPTVEFSIEAYSVDEDEGTATITVRLSAASGQTAMVDYATSDDTALDGLDYTAVNGTLVFNPGVTSQVFLVPITDDAEHEVDETIILTLSNPVNAVIGSNNPVPLIILDDDEPPTPTPTGPFITSSDYLVIPTQVILIDVNQHTPYGEYKLYWVNDSFAIVDVISGTLTVDESGFKRNIVFSIPGDNEGTYYIETQGDIGTVRSAPVEVTPPPPDLVVRSINLPEEMSPNEEITVTVEVENLSPGFVSGYFDVDLYVDPDNEPLPSRPGTSKQWVLGIGALETKVIPHVVTLYGGGAHELWAQVDTSDWVPDEFDETNNIFGPVGVTTASGECSESSDRFYGPELDTKWQKIEWGDASVHNQTIEEVDGNSALTIETSGSRISSSSDRATFLYQPFTGDFVATVKINWGPDTDDYAKMGLMVRANLNANSPFVSVLKTRDHGLQFRRRASAGASTSDFRTLISSGLPVWVRLVRNGDGISAFYSSDGSSWSEADGTNINNLPETVYVGIAGASYSGNSSTGNVDDFEICPIDAEADVCQFHSDDFEDDSTVEWSDADFGSTLPGGSSKSGGTMTVQGDGSSLWGTNENFHYTYQQVSGNFVATIKINYGPDQAEWSKAGLMVRDDLEPLSALVMLVSGNNGHIQLARRPNDGDSLGRPDGLSDDDVRNAPAPVWVRLSRNGNAFSAFYSQDGVNWNFIRSTTASMSEDIWIGMAVSSYDGSEVGDANFDDFLFCAGEAGAVEPPIIPPEVKPPGLKECVGNPQTIELGGFEATAISPPWIHSGYPHIRHDYGRVHSGNFSFLLRAEKLGPPSFRHLKPWVYQSVAVPSDVLAGTTGTLSYWQEVVMRPVGSNPGPDPDDSFYLAIRDSGGMTLTADIPLAYGDTEAHSATDPDVFHQNVISVENYLMGNRFADLAGQEIQLMFYGVHDGDDVGTYFYIDDVRFDICTTEPIPEDIPGTSSFGGLIEVLLAGVPTKMPGTQVWASRVGGELYRTQTIHDSTYHFYNVPPGTYVIYAEVWVGGYLYTSTTEVEASADERNYTVDMLLQ